MNKLTLAQKIALIPLLVILLMALMVGLNIYSLSRIAQQVELFTQVVEPGAKVASELAINTLQRLVVQSKSGGQKNQQLADQYKKLQQSNEQLLKSEHLQQFPSASQLVQNSKALDDLFITKQLPNQHKIALLEQKLLNKWEPEALESLAKIEATLDVVNAGQLPQLAVRFANHLQGASIALMQYVNQHHRRSLDRYYLELYGADNALFDLKVGLTREQHKRWIKEVSDDFNHYRSDASKLFAALKTNNKLLNEQVTPTAEKVVAQAQEAQQAMWTRLKNTSAAASSLLTRATTVSLSLAIIILAVALILSALIIMLIRRPILIMLRAMRDIAEGEGDLTKRLAVRGKDEIAQLGAAFNEFIIMLQKTVAGIGEYGRKLDSAANELTQLAQNAKSQVNEQQRSVQDISEHIEGVSIQVQELSEHVQSASGSADDIEQASTLGKQLSSATEESMSALVRQVDSVSEQMLALASDSQQMIQVLAVINEIAERTNLLSLNAAIEAARAGEYGRGFAVVADEVRQLAVQTQQSTEQIQSKINSLVDGSEQTQTKMAQGKEQVNLSQQHIEQMRDSVQQTHQLITAISQLLTLMRQMCDKEVYATQAVVEEIASIGQSANVSAQCTEQTAIQAEQVRSLTLDIQNTLARFKI